MNPASFFSWSFKCGVYVPIMAPFAFPLGLTLIDLLRRALFAKIQKKKDEWTASKKTEVKPEKEEEVNENDVY